jgi:hypothetical protein
VDPHFYNDHAGDEEVVELLRKAMRGDLKLVLKERR